MKILRQKLDRLVNDGNIIVNEGDVVNLGDVNNIAIKPEDVIADDGIIAKDQKKIVIKEDIHKDIDTGNIPVIDFEINELQASGTIPQLMYRNDIMGGYHSLNSVCDGNGFLSGVISNHDANLMALQHQGQEYCCSLFLASMPNDYTSGSYRGVQGWEFVFIGGNGPDSLYYKNRYSTYGLSEGDLLIRAYNTTNALMILHKDGRLTNPYINSLERRIEELEQRI